MYIDSHILNEFEKINSLQDRDYLMDRVDIKFIFNIAQLKEILLELIHTHNLVSFNKNCINSYKTIYFDTDKLDMYHQHHNGKLNRYKVRQRTYLDDNVCFLEVKQKNNKGRTLKNRISCNVAYDDFSYDSIHFLNKYQPFNPSDLHVKACVYYKRITLVHKTFDEKITLDLGLNTEGNGNHVCFNSLVIAEVKQLKKTNTNFVLMMKEKHIKQIAISKYCLGIASCFSDMKQNNFKQTLLHINKINNYDPFTIS